LFQEICTALTRMKAQIKRAVLRSGLLQLAGRVRGCSAAILMYHSVMEDPAAQEAYLGEIVHSRDVFRAQMELLAQRFHPTSLDQVGRFVKGEGEIPSRAVVVTFDDGYADNYDVAAPILQDVGVPATFYATVECVERRTLPWPARLRFCFRNTKKAGWTDPSGESWPLSSDVERENALQRSCDECCRLAGSVQEEYVARVANELDTHVPAASGSLMMSYEQMRALLRQGHIVGSHTMTHPNMAYVDPEVARGELSQSKQRLEKELGGAVQHFAYPCPALSPHWTEHTVAASRAAGYETAVTTNPGLSRSGDDPLRLKRVGANKTVEGLRWSLETAFAGRLR
jgi:peptidoglycan/xylan/chitin deacetylase (PgdA/CDA1 family)